MKIDINKFNLLQWYLAVGVLFFSGFFIFLFDAENPSSIYAIISAQFYLVSGIILFKNKNLAIYYLIKSRYPILICFLAFISVTWSYNSNLAITRSIALLGTLFFALALVVILEHKELIKVLVYPLFFAAVITIFIAIAFPAIGIDDGYKVSDHVGLWQGTYGFKNRLGRVMGLLVIILLSQQVITKVKTIYMLVITLFVLFMSGSSTPIIAVIIVSLIKLYFIFSHKVHSFFKAAIFITCLYILIFFPIFIEFIVIELMGKDLSGSGRVDMWVDILLSIDSPLTGYGFGGGFWGEFGYANGLIDHRYILLGHAHNGFVDTLIELGIIGVAFYFLLLLRGLVCSYKRIIDEGPYFYLSFFLLVFFVVYSLTGSAYIKQNNILFVLACVASFLPYKQVAKK